MMNWKWITGIWCLLWLLLAAGCTRTPESNSTDKSAHERSRSDAARAESPEQGGMSVTDGLGRVVVVPANPQRIISLAPRNTEILFAVGAGGQLAGVTTQCNFPAEAQLKERIGGFTTESMSLEKIVALKPDLVVSADEMHRPVITQLERLEIPVVAMGAGSLSGLADEIEMLGRITGHEQNARELVAKMRERMARVRARAAQIPADQRVTVYYQVWDNPLTAAGPATYFGEMIELCGAVNIVSDRSARYVEISEEVVVARDPDVILSPSVHAEQVTREQFTGRPGWAALRAVRNDRVYLIEGDVISRCGPRLVDALEAMSRCLYPEQAP